MYCTCLSISRDPFCKWHGDVNKVSATLLEQRDELLAALKHVEAARGFGSLNDETRERVRRAIAKAEAHDSLQEIYTRDAEALLRDADNR